MQIKKESIDSLAVILVGSDEFCLRGIYICNKGRVNVQAYISCILPYFMFWTTLKKENWNKSSV